MFTADPEHPPIQVGEFTEKIALLRANDDEGLEDEYSVRREEGERERERGREGGGERGREREREGEGGRGRERSYYRYMFVFVN